MSRDLKELGYVKSAGGGPYIRTAGPPPSGGPAGAPAPPSSLPTTGEALLRRLLVDLPLEIEQAGQILVIRTLPGYAHSLAAGLDACRWPEAAGTVAGDDTIFVALRDPARGEQYRQRLLTLADGAAGSG